MNIIRTLLLIIDVQNDFCPGGALAVKDGDEVIAPLNILSASIAEGGGRVAATQDWHPIDHVSFASSHNGAPGEIVNGQMLWPNHCVQNSTGASFHKDLDLNPVSMIIRKGFRKGLDSYSAFFENDRQTPTGLDGWIRSLKIETVIMGGLATDYCVFFSAMDCKNLGFNVIVLTDAVRGVGIPEGSVDTAINKMKSAGIKFLPSNEIIL